MSRLCSKCHREFSGIYVHLLTWHLKQKRYICGRCWHWPKKGNGEVTGRGYIWVAYFILMFLLFGLLSLEDHMKRQGWQELETISVDELNNGKLAKLEGTINAGKGVIVLDGKEQGGGKGADYWVWNEDAIFIFTDGSSNLTVKCCDYYDIASGRHPSSHRSETEGTNYQGGDEVVIVGTLEQEGDETWFSLLWMGPDEEELESSALGSMICLSLGTLFVLLAFFIANRRGRIHDKLMAGVVAADWTWGPSKRNGRGDWRRNSDYIRGYLTFLAVLGTASTLLAFFYKSGYEPNTQRELEMFYYLWLLLLMGVGLLLFILNLLTGIFYKKPRYAPAGVKFSAKGIHLFSPHPAFVGKEFVSWNMLGSKVGSLKGRDFLGWGLDHESRTTLKELNRDNRERLFREREELS